MPRKSLKQIMAELQSLSGMANTVEEGGIDWIVPRSDLSDEDDQILRRLGQMWEEDEAEKAAAKHTVKGKIESLAERLEGIVDFIDKEDYKAATLAMNKIYEDLGALLKEMKKRTADKAESDKEKEKEEKEAEQAQAQMDQGGEAGDQQYTGQTNRPGETSTNSGAAQQQAMQPGSTQKEGVVFIGGELIEGTTPFGADFMEEIRSMAGIRPRRKK